MILVDVVLTSELPCKVEINSVGGCAIEVEGRACDCARSGCQSVPISYKSTAGRVLDDGETRTEGTCRIERCITKSTLIWSLTATGINWSLTV